MPADSADKTQIRNESGEAGAHAQGRLEAIWLKRAKRGPMDPQQNVRAVAGRGLEGNANQGGRRQVTLIDAQRWRDVEEELKQKLDPRLRRANLMVSGIDLQDSRGRVLQIGSCRIRIHGETRPCRQMDDAVPGLLKALDPQWRGGACGQVLDDGDIRIGDPVIWL